MNPNTLKKLEAVLQERLTLQYENENPNYTPEEMLAFALEEAHQNGELDFLCAPILLTPNNN